MYISKLECWTDIDNTNGVINSVNFFSRFCQLIFFLHDWEWPKMAYRTCLYIHIFSNRKIVKSFFIIQQHFPLILFVSCWRQRCSITKTDKWLKLLTLPLPISSSSSSSRQECTHTWVLILRAWPNCTGKNQSYI